MSFPPLPATRHLAQMAPLAYTGEQSRNVTKNADGSRPVLQLAFLNGLKSEDYGEICPSPAARISLLASRPLLTHSSSLSLSRFALTLRAIIVIPAALASFWRCTFCFSSSAL